MGYTTVQFHNAHARFIFDIYHLSIFIWKHPKNWYFYFGEQTIQIWPIEFFLHK